LPNVRKRPCKVNSHYFLSAADYTDKAMQSDQQYIFISIGLKVFSISSDMFLLKKISTPHFSKKNELLYQGTMAFPDESGKSKIALN
jgi:hypothetical protein